MRCYCWYWQIFHLTFPGTTLTLASAAGCPGLTSTHSRASKLSQTGQGIGNLLNNHFFLFNLFTLALVNFLSDFRAVAVVVDPIQSVKGKVVIDAFRLINPNMMVRNWQKKQYSHLWWTYWRMTFHSEIIGSWSRTQADHQCVGTPSIQALIHGLNRWEIVNTSSF